MEAVLRGIKFEQKDFKSQEDVLNLQEECIFNCTGYSSKYLFNDESMTGNTGHMLVFKNHTALDYSLGAKLKDGLRIRVHCFGKKIIVRSDTSDRSG